MTTATVTPAVKAARVQLGIDEPAKHDST